MLSLRFGLNLTVRYIESMVKDILSLCVGQSVPLVSLPNFYVINQGVWPRHIPTGRRMAPSLLFSIVSTMFSSLPRPQTFLIVWFSKSYILNRDCISQTEICVHARIQFHQWNPAVRWPVDWYLVLEQISMPELILQLYVRLYSLPLSWICLELCFTPFVVVSGQLRFHAFSMTPYLIKSVFLPLSYNT